MKSPLRTNLFPPTKTPRVFGCPPGQDFSKSLVAGLRIRLGDQNPEAIARVTLYVNSTRMARAVEGEFQTGAPGFLPRIRLITSLAQDFPSPEQQSSISDIRRQLELRQLVGQLVEKLGQDGNILAPVSSVPDMADSLARILDEMNDEAVTPEDLRALDISDQSGHWERSLKFLEIVTKFTGLESAGTSASAIFRSAAERVADLWQAIPPADPILIAGSTGSRGTTAVFMKAVAKLPQGAVVLPGFDFEMPETVWAEMQKERASTDGPRRGEDHPQFRFVRLMSDLGLVRPDVSHWDEELPNVQKARNALVSLALRPAPVTNSWMNEAPDLGLVPEATSRMTLITAETPRQEAIAIALALRQAAETHQTATLITPDQGLTRQVTAALAQWGIVPDASIGEPLHQTAVGIFMRLALAFSDKDAPTPGLLALFKHPLVGSGSDRGRHLSQTRAFELWIRGNSIPFVEAPHLDAWAERAKSGADADWVAWAKTVLTARLAPKNAGLETFLDWHVQLAQLLVAGPKPDASSDELWAKKSGESLQILLEDLRQEAEFGGYLRRAEYAELFEMLLADREIREAVIGVHPKISILGTLEARGHKAQIVILGGLNESSWPEIPAADPWLNRSMRDQAGLLLPDRKIGLSAHDFQQAIGATEVYLTRSKRSADAETVPSRWLNRLTNMLAGTNEAGAVALREMAQRGDRLCAMARALEAPGAGPSPALRPAPAPPVEFRPKEFWVTDITKLIRDPYAIYARRVLNLRPIKPLLPKPNAAFRGIVLHRIMEEFMPELDPNATIGDQEASLMALADRVLGSDAPWPEVRVLWKSKLARINQLLLLAEASRRADVHQVSVEAKGRLLLPDGESILRCKADRVDHIGQDLVAIYDYKAGVPPIAKLTETHEKQLWLEALISRDGGFEGMGRRRAERIAYIGLDGKATERSLGITEDKIDAVLVELGTLLEAYYQQSRGYVARRDPKKEFGGDYDHLARFGEWDDADKPATVAVP